MLSGFSSDIQYEEPTRSENKIVTEFYSSGNGGGGGSYEQPILVVDPPIYDQPPEPVIDPIIPTLPAPEPTADPDPVEYDDPDIDTPTMPIPDKTAQGYDQLNMNRMKQFYDDNKMLVLGTGAFIGMVVLLK